MRKQILPGVLRMSEFNKKYKGCFISKSELLLNEEIRDHEWAITRLNSTECKRHTYQSVLINRFIIYANKVSTDQINFVLERTRMTLAMRMHGQLSVSCSLSDEGNLFAYAQLLPFINF